jgi:hypothetical protein
VVGELLGTFFFAASLSPWRPKREQDRAYGHDYGHDSAHGHGGAMDAVGAMFYVEKLCAMDGGGAAGDVGEVMLILLCCSLYCCACMFVLRNSCMSCSQLMHAR